MIVEPLTLSVIMVAVAAVLVLKHLHKPKDIEVPEPTVLRTDLLYGYYGTVGTQAWETRGSVNLLWESQFEGHEKAADNMLTAKTFTVLDLGPQLFYKFAASGNNFQLFADFKQRVREVLSFYHSKDVLQYVKALCIMDEPNTNVIDKETFQLAINAVKLIAKEFPELANVKYACIYAAKPVDYWCIEEFDYVGTDDYDKLSSYFTDGTYEEVTSRMHTDAKTIILPGGGFGQELKPFWNFAHNNKEVGMLIPFTWLDGREPGDKWIGLGNPLNVRKLEYMKAGARIHELGKKI